MPLGLPRRSYDSGPSAPRQPSVAVDDDERLGGHGKRASEKHSGRPDHRRSASFNDATPRPRAVFPLPGPLFKGSHDHRRLQPKSSVDLDSHADGHLDLNSATPQGHHIDVGTPEPFAVSSQIQPHHHRHQPPKLFGFFTQSTAVNGKGSLPSKSHSPQSNKVDLNHNHSRSEVLVNTIKDNSNGMTSVASSTNLNRGHTTSPTKPSSARTYDAKLVTREMHRLGSLAGFSPAIAPSLSSGPSASTLTLPSTSPSTAALGPSSSLSHVGGLPGTNGSDKDNPWGTLHVHVLPLFNEEPLRVPIEDLNTLVRRHIQTVLAASPSKALATLSVDARELIAAGMVTLNAKLATISDELLMSRLVEVWSFFWDHVLPYVEGIIIGPTPFPDRPTPNIPTPNRETTPIVVAYSAGRLLVLVSERRAQPASPTLSLRAPSSQPNPNEAAIAELLCLFSQARHNAYNPYPQRRSFTQGGARSTTPNFLSARIPRDRRGRIGGTRNMGSMILNAGGWTVDTSDTVVADHVRPEGSALCPGGDEMDNEGVETPRIGGMERGRDIPLVLRPSIEHHHRASTGGWGLGAGQEERREEDDDEETLD
ncbi:hypothetical protein ID866_1406 [Astraeus odoratus]|nr:hypothetical protein ID866_1406 [Astraeus odoratus]